MQVTTQKISSPFTSLCPACTPWCATTEKQFANRQANMNCDPQVKPHNCPECGSAAWATTRVMIRAEPARPWWRRWW